MGTISLSHTSLPLIVAAYFLAECYGKRSLQPQPYLEQLSSSRGWLAM